MKKLRGAMALLLSLLLMFGGCKADVNDSNKVGNETDGIVSSSDESSMIKDTVVSGEPTEAIDAEGAFSSRDLDTEYDPDTAVKISLSDAATFADSDAVMIAGDVITITDEGDYIISGKLSDGMIIVDAEKTDKLRLILDGTEIHSASSAAIYIKTADKVFITLADGSENSLYTDGAYTAIDENNIDAAVFSKEDVTFNGCGSLTVSSSEGHGIVSKDDVKITGGVYNITSAGHGISGKDRVYIADGDFTITSDKDGVHSENADDASLGEVLITGGSFKIDADGDGVSGSAVVQVNGGSIAVTAGGGAENGEVHSDSMGNMGGLGGWWGDYDDTSTTDTTDTVSKKGIKSDGSLFVNGGEISVDSADDALHAGSDIAVANGILNLATGDDGVHADVNVTVSGGALTITESYEGIEGAVINIAGGVTKLNASDDGMNAAGGTSVDMGGFGGFGGLGGMGGMMEGSDEYGVNISGGYIYLNANGDGIDSNGYLSVTGGETYIDGPTNSGNGALDYGTSATISNGIFVAVGASGMASNFGSDSTQGAIMCSVSASVDLGVSLSDEDGEEIISFSPAKTYSSVLISTPDIEADGTYIISVGDASSTIEMNGYIYGGGGGMGGGGRPGGGRPGR